MVSADYVIYYICICIHMLLCDDRKIASFRNFVFSPNETKGNVNKLIFVSLR